ncbi:MAG: hypothetical protein WA160_04840 [Pseudobdellovibrio sp.]
MKKILLTICALAIVGCEDVGGNFTVFKNFTAYTSNGLEVIPTGNYKTGLNFKRKVVVAKMTSSSKEVSINIQIPKDTEIPNNGNFEIRATQSGQPFNVLGMSKTDEERTANQTSFGSCQYQGYQQVCNPQGCVTVPVTRMGQQFTYFYYSTITKDMQIDLVDTNSAATKLAHFSGGYKVTTKVIQNQSQCM